MKMITTILCLLPLFGFSCGGQKPKGKLIYCSCSETRMAGLGKDYCELIADEGKLPKVVICLNANNDLGEPEIKKEYPATSSDVEQIATLLQEAEVYKLNGYNKEEEMTGGASYRVYMEYSSGEKVDIHWYSHTPSEKARQAYNLIDRFFSKWRNK